MTPHREAEIGEILARVEKATGPDREIDAALAIVFGWTHEVNIEEDFECWRDTNGKAAYLPRLTDSIDAITRLIERQLPGWHIASGTVGEQDTPWACLTEPDGEFRDFAAHHVSEALARTEALLRALLTTKGQSHVE